ncbi:MAG: hypothetical protein QNJ92_13640 [Alphaproteobacteria bacterium]|nr:hypothetical protein [Alphaproteobacteria bacterium]
MDEDEFDRFDDRAIPFADDYLDLILTARPERSAIVQALPQQTSARCPVRCFSN